MSKHPQIKKCPTDPDADQLNPEIVQLAKSNGFIKQPLILFLHGELTWSQALETMILSLTKEFRAQQNLLIVTLQEATIPIMLPPTAGKLLKSLPPRPLHSTSPEILHHEQSRITPLGENQRQDAGLPESPQEHRSLAEAGGNSRPGGYSSGDGW